jgi:hypothetical protein
LDVKHAVDAVRKLLVNLVDLVDDVSVEADGNAVGELGRENVEVPARGHETQVRFEAEILLDDVSEDFIGKLQKPATVLRETAVHKDAAHGWHAFSGSRTKVKGRREDCSRREIRNVGNVKSKK